MKICQQKFLTCYIAMHPVEYTLKLTRMYIITKIQWYNWESCVKNILAFQNEILKLFNKNFGSKNSSLIFPIFLGRRGDYWIKNWLKLKLYLINTQNLNFLGLNFFINFSSSNCTLKTLFMGRYHYIIIRSSNTKRTGQHKLVKIT